MNWSLLGIVPQILLVLFFVVLLWGTKQMWKVNKFISAVFLVMAVAVAITFYALYGKKIFG